MVTPYLLFWDVIMSAFPQVFLLTAKLTFVPRRLFLGLPNTPPVSPPPGWGSCSAGVLCRCRGLAWLPPEWTTEIWQVLCLPWLSVQQRDTEPSTEQGLFLALLNTTHFSIAPSSCAKRRCTLPSQMSDVLLKGPDPLWRGHLQDKFLLLLLPWKDDILAWHKPFFSPAAVFLPTVPPANTFPVYGHWGGSHLQDGVVPDSGIAQ